MSVATSTASLASPSMMGTMGVMPGLIWKPAADEAGSVAGVHHDERAVPGGELADVAQRREGAVHGEHAVGRDHLDARAGRRRRVEPCGEISHVDVLVAVALRLAEADAVDD